MQRYPVVVGRIISFLLSVQILLRFITHYFSHSLWSSAEFFLKYLRTWIESNVQCTECSAISLYQIYVAESHMTYATEKA
jgi:hypothetical protein